MNELYWITRCNAIATTATIFLIISAIITAIFIVMYIDSKGDNDTSGIVLSKSVLKISSPIFIISLLLEIFVPTTDEALLIYGVGNTIDYVKENPTAQKLPDKCIKALDKWVDSFTPEKNDSIKNKK